MNIREIFERTTVNENTNVEKLVIDINCSVFNIVHKRLFKNIIEEGNVRHLAKAVCKIIKANVPNPEEATNLLENIIKDTSNVIAEMKERDNPATLLCAMIATASDTQTHYTAIENSILIFAAADFCDIKFEF